MQLVEKIESFSLKDRSVTERLVFVKDGIKITQNNILLGNGGKGWLYNYKDVQSYNYSSTEVHNYFLQIFIDNGIIAPLIWLGLMAYALIKIFKRRNKINEIDMAFILLSIHSLMDFDLSFYCMMVLWIILFVLVVKDDNTKLEGENNKKLNKIMYIAIIIINIIIAIIGGITINITNDNEEKLNNIKKLIERQEYDQAIEKIAEYQENEQIINLYYNIIGIDYYNIEQENLEYIFEIIAGEKIKIDTAYNMYRYDVILKILEQTDNEEIATKLANIVIEENEEMIANIKDKDKNRLTDEKINSYLEKYENIYYKAQKRLE
jgi:hypothetical protein